MTVHQVNAKRCTPLDPAFLPAAIELLDTPPSPLGRTILWTVIGLLLVAASWSTWARIDIVTIAPGQVIPRGKVKVVQAPAQGQIDALHADEGQQVAAGALLVELNATEALAEVDLIDREQREIQLRLERLQILTPLIDKIDDYDAENEPSVDIERLPIIQQAMLRLQIDDYLAKLVELESEQKQLASDRQTAQSMADHRAKLLPLITQRSDAIKRLMERGQASTYDWLEIEQERVDLEQLTITARTQVKSSDAALLRVQSARQRMIAGWRRDLVEQRIEAERQHAALAQRRVQADGRLRQLHILAPVSGTVEQLQIHTIGGAVASGQVLMHIVPDAAEPMIEARISNRDISDVALDMHATVKLEAYPFTRYGTLDGVVRSISRDALGEPSDAQVYLARIQPGNKSDASISIDHLRPGMIVTTEVKTGHRRVIELLLDPVLRALDEAGRER